MELVLLNLALFYFFLPLQSAVIQREEEEYINK